MVRLVAIAGSVALAATACAADETVFIRAGKVVTGTGEEIERGEIVIVDGRIELVGRQLDVPPGARVFEALDQTVMPGLIDARCRYGLSGYNRAGVHGDLTVDSELYLSEIDFEPLLEAGFTAVCFEPDGTGMPGRSVVYRTGGPEGSRRVKDAAWLVTMSNPGRDKGVLSSAIEKAKAEIKKVEDARKKFEEERKKAEEEAKKRAEEQKKQEGDKPGEGPKPEEGKPAEKQPEEAKPKEFEPPEIDAAHRFLVDMIRGEGDGRLLVEIRRSSDLVHLDDVLERHKIGEKKDRMLPHDLHLSGVGSSDYNYVVGRLGERKALVLAWPAIDMLPDTVIRCNVIAELSSAGARVALTPRSDGVASYRGYREQVAEVVRAGLPRGEGILGMTGRVAELLGVQGEMGTIEKGKAADLVFLDGDVFELGSRVRGVMILGEVVWEADDAN